MAFVEAEALPVAAAQAEGFKCKVQSAKRRAQNKDVRYQSFAKNKINAKLYNCRTQCPKFLIPNFKF